MTTLLVRSPRIISCLAIALGCLTAQATQPTLPERDDKYVKALSSVPGYMVKYPKLAMLVQALKKYYTGTTVFGPKEQGQVFPPHLQQLFGEKTFTYDGMLIFDTESPHSVFVYRGVPRELPDIDQDIIFKGKVDGNVATDEKLAAFYALPQRQARYGVVTKYEVPAYLLTLGAKFHYTFDQERMKRYGVNSLVPFIAEIGIVDRQTTEILWIKVH
jgi:hypothetical protein